MQKACPWQAAMIWLMKLWRRMQNAEARWLAWCLGRYDFNYALSWQQIGLNWPSGHASSFPDSIHSFPDTWIYIIMLTLSNYCKVYKFTVWQQLINAQCQTLSRCYVLITLHFMLLLSDAMRSQIEKCWDIRLSYHSHHTIRWANLALWCLGLLVGSRTESPSASILESKLASRVAYLRPVGEASYGPKVAQLTEDWVL